MKFKFITTLFILFSSLLSFSQITITSKTEMNSLEERKTGKIKDLGGKSIDTFIEFNKNFTTVKFTNDDYKMSAKIDETIKISETKDLYKITTIEGAKYAVIVDQDENCVVLSTEIDSGLFMVRYDVYKIFDSK